MWESQLKAEERSSFLLLLVELHLCRSISIGQFRVRKDSKHTGLNWDIMAAKHPLPVHVSLRMKLKSTMSSHASILCVIVL